MTLLAACGGGGGGGSSGDPAPPVSGGPPRLELLAGAIGGIGSNDGEARFARAYRPQGVAVDPTGRIFIADTDNRTIRLLAGGQVTTVAGIAGVPGFVDGPAASARFNNPEDLAVDPAGNVYVADTLNHSIRRITPDGVVSTFAGNGTAGYTDGPGAAARFDRPRGIARDEQGTLFVADERNHVIRAISSAGVVSTVAGLAGTSGFADGAGGAARFTLPVDVAVDAQGRVWVADAGNQVLRRIAAGVVTTVAGSPGSGGTADGAAGLARFYALGGVTVDGAGNAFVTDAHRVRRVDSAGTVTTLAGRLDSTGISGRRDGAGSEAEFNSPRGLAMAAEGVIVADTGNDTVRRVTFAGAVSALVGDFAGARFSNLRSGVADGQERLLVTDGLILRQVDANGDISTVATYPLPDGLENARLFGIAMDGSGSPAVVVRRCAIRFGPGAGLPAACTGSISRVAGGSFMVLAGSETQAGGQDGIGTNARFEQPDGIAAGAAGVLFVADTARDTIRRIASDGSVTTLAGRDDSCPLFGARPALSDGAAAGATFCGPNDVAVDGAGNVYVADAGYRAIRKITPAGIVSTLAGGSGDNCTEGSGVGLGAAARFCSVRGLAVDPAGVVYVADGNTVRRISPAGEVTTIAGAARDSGFVTGALPGRLTDVMDVVLSGSDLYVILPTAVAVIRNRP